MHFDRGASLTEILATSFCETPWKFLPEESTSPCSASKECHSMNKYVTKTTLVPSNPSKINKQTPKTGRLFPFHFPVCFYRYIIQARQSRDQPLLVFYPTRALFVYNTIPASLELPHHISIQLIPKTMRDLKNQHHGGHQNGLHKQLLQLPLPRAFPLLLSAKGGVA